eukprot:m.260969 g.260969  ORF g.260969 m.260969 type:complete len:60 (+) comp26780_c1_seq18:1464-1643(+)
MTVVDIRLVQLECPVGQVPVQVPGALSSSLILQRPQDAAIELFLDPNELYFEMVKKSKM